MTELRPGPHPIPRYVRALAVLIAAVVCALGLLAINTGYVEGRWTRFGYAGPLAGEGARSFGMAIMWFGLMPLALLARSPRSAAWFASSMAVLGLLSLFLNL